MDLHARVVARYIEVNGEHPMTAADDHYVDQHFVRLADISPEPDRIREHMLAEPGSGRAGVAVLSQWPVRVPEIGDTAEHSA